jgi:hypothetical protein
VTFSIFELEGVFVREDLSAAKDLSMKIDFFYLSLFARGK